MKNTAKSLLVAGLFGFSLGSSAQSIVVHTKDGTTFTHQTATIADVTFDENATPAFAFVNGSTNEVLLDSNPGSVEVSFNAQNYWVLTDLSGESWWKLDKQYGLAGQNKLVVTAESNAGSKERLGSFTLLCGSEAIEFIVRQSDASHNQYVAIPDDTFRSFCLSRYDADKDGHLSYEEALAITTLSLYNQGISSLEGIRYMKNLESLDCDKNNIEGTLDLSGLAKLKEVNCSHNFYTTLSLNGCESLTTLTANDNYREEGWQVIFSLQHIDLTGCKNLSVIKIDDNALVAMDLKDCVSLTDLNCSINQISSFDFSNCPKLKYLHCRNNKLTGQTLDLTMCSELSYLSCYDSGLEGLKLGNKPALQQLLGYNNSLSEINVSQCPKLYQLELTSNKLTALDVTNNPELQTLDVAYNPVVMLDVSHNPQLTTLDVSGTKISSLNLSQQTRLKTLSANTAALESLNLKNCRELYTLSAYQNGLTSLDLSDCENLFQMNVNNNHLSTLDVSSCPKVAIVNCNNNLLESFNANNCAQLYSLDLESNQLVTLDLYSLRSLQEVYASKNRIQEIKMMYLDHLATAELYDNQLSSLDLSGLNSLTELHLQHNQLTTIDLKPCEVLVYVDVRGNLMKELVLTDNLALTTVYATECPNLKTIYINEENALAELHFDEGVTVLYGYPSGGGEDPETPVDPELEGYFTKVTQLATITTGHGEKYLLVCQKPNGTCVTLNERQSSNYVTSAEVTVGKDGIEATDEVFTHALTLDAGSTDGSFSIAGEGIYASKPYLCSMGTYDASILSFGKISFQNSATAVSPERTYWNISFDAEGHVIVESGAYTGWSMRFNNDSNSQQFGVCQEGEPNTLSLSLYKCAVK